MATPAGSDKGPRTPSPGGPGGRSVKLLSTQDGAGAYSRTGHTTPPSGQREKGLPDLDLRGGLLQDQALHGGGVALQAEHGPRIIRILCGSAAGLSAVLACYSFFRSGTSFLLLSLYQLLFAAMALPFELALDGAALKPLAGLQELLLDKAGFLRDLFTRGLFYILQGTLWLSVCWCLHVRGIFCVVGAFMVTVGFACSVLHLFGCSNYAIKLLDGEEDLSMGPPVSGRTYNTQQMAEQRVEALGDTRNLSLSGHEAR